MLVEQPFLGAALGLAGHLWIEVRDGNRTALSVLDRHYTSTRAHVRKVAIFIGPGEKMALLSPCARAMFAWRRELYRLDGQTGINCAVFRNEGAPGALSSELIEAADYLATLRWPGERHYTYVDSRKIRGTNPGYCFLAAGWHRCGMSKGGLHILERLP